MAKLKTGDVERFKREECSEVVLGDKWATIANSNDWILSKVWSWKKRHEAREIASLHGERIAKILKVTPKTVTVEIIK